MAAFCAAEKLRGGLIGRPGLELPPVCFQILALGAFLPRLGQGVDIFLYDDNLFLGRGLFLDGKLA